MTQIDTLWQGGTPVNYEYIVQQSQAGNSVAASDLTAWANSVVSGQINMPSALTAIANQIDGSGNGALYSTCVAAQLKSAGITDFAGTDDVYYQNFVQPITAYWTTVQVKALTMYVEAQHYLACVSANQCGNTSTDISNLPQQVCGQASPGSSAYRSCQLAQQQVIGSPATTGTRGGAGPATHRGGRPLQQSDRTRAHARPAAGWYHHCAAVAAEADQRGETPEAG